MFATFPVIVWRKPLCCGVEHNMGTACYEEQPKEHVQINKYVILDKYFRNNFKDGKGHDYIIT